MFVSKRRVGKRPYFYLEDKVKGKRLAFFLGLKEQAPSSILGAFDSLVQSKALENLKHSQKRFKANVFGLSELLSLERLKVDYAVLKSFFPISFESLKEEDFVRYAQGSASVEGNSLSLREAALVLQKGIAVSGKKLGEIKEIENMRLAAKVSAGVKEFNEKSLLKIHSAIMDGFDEKKPGQFRDGPMFITGSKIKPPPAQQVSAEIKKLFSWLEKNSTAIHSVELACEFHARFEEIHPFWDGNGRVGREVLNLMLQKKGYPRAIINLENRQSYIALLERVQLNKEYNKFSKFIFLCLEKRAQEIEKILKENKPQILKKLLEKVN